MFLRKLVQVLKKNVLMCAAGSLEVYPEMLYENELARCQISFIFFKKKKPWLVGSVD